MHHLLKLLTQTGINPTKKTGVGFVILLLLSAMSSAQELDIDVLGLFKDRAMLNISGKRLLLSAGERSPEGVLLVSADSRQAVIEVSGTTFILNLSSRIGTMFKTPTSASVSILLSNSGQYRTSGSINGRQVSFLVDTGANVVAINTPTAHALGIDPSKGRLMHATTAGGVVESHLVFLDVVEIGGIRVNNVKAAVIKGEYPQEVLLGMSFLQNVKIKEDSGVMQLTHKL